MKTILLLLFGLSVNAQVATIKLNDGTSIINAPGGRDWKDYKVKGLQIFDDEIIRIDGSDESKITHNGDWTKSSTCNCSYSRIANDHVIVKFTNTNSFSWYGEKMTHHGIAEIFLDGVQRATIDTYGPDNETDVLNWRIDGLDKNKVYTFQLNVKGDKNAQSTNTYIVIKYFELGTDAPIPPPVVADTVYIRDTIRIYYRPVFEYEEIIK